MNAKDAAKWHREQATLRRLQVLACAQGSLSEADEARASVNHALAARVLDALAVLPPVLFDNLLAKHGGVLTEDQRTALRTLRSEAKGE